MRQHTGPLVGLKILEFAGIGPVPFCGRLFSDSGADVLRIDRPNHPGYDRFAVDTRGRTAITLDLKQPRSRDIALDLIQSADALIEGFRPGVMERLGLGPDEALARNPKLIYGRMTGWGQTGPLANAPGHDMNYVALSGALHALGPKEHPVVPLNLLGDFGGGALYLAFGIMAALRHVEQGGGGQVIDCAMSEGVGSMMNLIYGKYAAGLWQDHRESNIIDGGAHFYNSYECADGKWIAIGSIETQFYRALLEALDIEGGEFEGARFDDQMNQAYWPKFRRAFTAIFRTRTRDDWCAHFAGTEVCYAPVLSLAEAPNHPHNRARDAFIEIDGVVQPAPLPRFSKTPAAAQRRRSLKDAEGEAALKDWGIDDALIRSLRERT